MALDMILSARMVGGGPAHRPREQGRTLRGKALSEAWRSQAR